MLIPGPLDFRGDRWTAFETTLRLTGIDLTDAVMQMQIRTGADAPGVPLADLGTVTTTNTEGLRLVGVATENSVKVSTVLIRINKLTMKALPAAPERGQDRVLAWDLLINPVAALNPHLPGIEQRYLKGSFIVEAGVTQ